MAVILPYSLNIKFKAVKFNLPKKKVCKFMSYHSYIVDHGCGSRGIKKSRIHDRVIVLDNS